MKTKIFCKTTDKGIHTFYLQHNDNNYYLFRQSYRRGVSEYFRGGVTLEEAMNFGRSKNNEAIQKTMQKLPLYIKYAEKEYGIQVLKQTIKKNARFCHRISCTACA